MAKASQTTTSNTKTKVTVKAKSGASSTMETCHMCDGKGVVPKSWYSGTKSKSKKK